jgi:SAM-dependent methyltransferase
MSDRQEHWEAVYRTKASTEVSWYQAEPAISLAMVRTALLDGAASVLDVGGGASVLVDRLLEVGLDRIGVLDISSAALETARNRLGPAADRVEWIHGDLLEYTPAEPWDIWHDRAVFHFLTDPEDRRRYRDAVLRSVPPGGHVIVATFGPEGPDRCSGLDTLRCSPGQIVEELGPGLELADSAVEVHHTPSGSDQQFVYARMIRIEPE